MARPLLEPEEAEPATYPRNLKGIHEQLVVGADEEEAGEITPEHHWPRGREVTKPPNTNMKPICRGRSRCPG